MLFYTNDLSLSYSYLHCITIFPKNGLRRNQKRSNKPFQTKLCLRKKQFQILRIQDWMKGAVILKSETARQGDKTVISERTRQEVLNGKNEGDETKTGQSQSD
jgi:hypothetical protein